MFIDLDECITDDDLNSNEPFHVYSCIRDVKFTRNAEQFIVHRVHLIFFLTVFSHKNITKLRIRVSYGTFLVALY